MGEASIRRVTPKRRVSISIAEADSDVRNTNRISSCAAPAWNVPIWSRPRRSGRSRRPSGCALSSASAAVRASSKPAAAPSETANRAARTTTLCSSTTPFTTICSSVPEPPGRAIERERHRLALRGSARRSPPGSPGRPRVALLHGGTQIVGVGERPDRQVLRRLEPIPEVLSQRAGPAGSTTPNVGVKPDAERGAERQDDEEREHEDEERPGLVAERAAAG